MGRLAMRVKQRVAICLCAGLIGLSLSHVDVRACALLVSSHTREQFIVGEEAIIVWNAKDKLQHLIRRADFATDGADLGFIVPTPSKPELYEAALSSFQSLHGLIHPRVQRHEYNITWTLMDWLAQKAQAIFSVFNSITATVAVPVRVLETKGVSGYEAVILEADNTPALLDWLRRNRYEAPPAFQAWLEPYVTKGWKITAFKYAKTGNGEQIKTKPVRMSFTTDTPFFPYREPTLEPTETRNYPQRHLRIYVIASERVEAGFGKDGTQPWRDGRLKGAIRLQEAARHIGGSMPASSIPQDAWLTAFFDQRINRVGGDLYFQASANQSVVKPRPIIDRIDQRLLIPLDVIAVIAAGLWGVSRFRKRRRASLSGEPLSPSETE